MASIYAPVYRQFKQRNFQHLIKISQSSSRRKVYLQANKAQMVTSNNGCEVMVLLLHLEIYIEPVKNHSKMLERIKRGAI